MIFRRVWWSVLSLCLVIALCATASAGPRRVLVLPLDGNADPELRSKLNATLQKLTRDGARGATVTVGDATFDETAAAVGCGDPSAPKCAVSVRTTLGVDELVYGTVTTDPAGQTTMVVRRSSVTANPPNESTATLAKSDPPEAAERQLAPAFGVTDIIKPPDPEPQPAPVGPTEDHSRRNIGIACTAGGGVIAVIGVALWFNVSSKQDQIDAHPTNNAMDLQKLQDLEDRTQTIAILGDVMVVGGLVLAGYGGWVLYKDRSERRIVVSPAAAPTGPAITIGGVW